MILLKSSRDMSIDRSRPPYTCSEAFVVSLEGKFRGVDLLRSRVEDSTAAYFFKLEVYPHDSFFTIDHQRLHYLEDYDTLRMDFS
jgi:hypothetical protein